jgi:hypothetical protein
MIRARVALPDNDNSRNGNRCYDKNYKTNPKKAMVISEEEILIKVSFFF